MKRETHTVGEFDSTLSLSFVKRQLQTVLSVEDRSNKRPIKRMIGYSCE